MVHHELLVGRAHRLAKEFQEQLDARSWPEAASTATALRILCDQIFEREM